MAATARRAPAWFALAALLAVTACSGDDGSSATTVVATTEAPVDTAPPTTEAPVDTAPPTTEVFDGYVASIMRTEYGVPHIVADDWGSLGFGQGYAFAQDRACTLIDQVIKVRGERSKWFGVNSTSALPYVCSMNL